MALTPTEQRRISFLSLLSSAAAYSSPDYNDAYDQAGAWLRRMHEDGYFDEGASRPTSQPSPTSRGQGSRSSNGSGGNATPKQVSLLLKLTEDYSRSDLEAMSKNEASDLITQLKDW